MIPAPIYGHVKKPTDKDQSQTHCTSSDRRHYLHTADNRSILHTSNTLVRTAPIMCSRHCVIRQEALLCSRHYILHTSNTLVQTAPIMCSRHCVAGGTTYTLQITDVFYIPLTPWCGPIMCSRHCVIRQEALLTHCR